VQVEGRVRVMPLDVIAAVQSLKALDILFDGVYWAAAGSSYMPGPPQPKKAKRAPGEPGAEEEDAMDVDEGSAEEPAGSQEEAEVEPDVPEEEDEDEPKRKKSRKGAK